MSTAATTDRTRRSPVQLTALLVSIAFVLVGVLGFVPGVTTDLGQLGGAGHHSGAHLLGVFQVSVLHNLLHLGLGVVGLLAALRPTPAKLYLVVGGLVYLVLTVYGAAVDPTSTANFVPLNTADNWLHLGLGLGMVLLGLVMPRRTTYATARGTHGPSAGGDVQ